MLYQLTDLVQRRLEGKTTSFGQEETTLPPGQYTVAQVHSRYAKYSELCYELPPHDSTPDDYFRGIKHILRSSTNLIWCMKLKADYIDK